MPVAGRSTGCFALTDNAANTMQPSSSVWYSSIFLSIHIILFSSRRYVFPLDFTPRGSFARYKRLNFYELPPDGFWFSGLFYLILDFKLGGIKTNSPPGASYFLIKLASGAFQIQCKDII